MSTTLRPVAPSEQIHLDAGVSAAFVVECSGTIDAALLARAHAALAEEAPVLRARVERTAEGNAFALRDTAPELVVREWDGPGGTGAVDPSLDPERLLARAELVRDVSGQGADIVGLVMHHAIADGPPFKALLARLFAHYTALVETGEPLPAQPVPFPGATEDALAGRYDDAALDEAYALRLASMTEHAVRAWEPDTPLERGASAEPFHQVLIALDRETTDALITAAKAGGTSPYAAACGAVMIAERGQLLPATGPLAMACVSAVDLRERSGGPAPVGVMEVTNLVATHRSVVEVRPQGDAVEVGRGIKALLDDAIAREEPQRMAMNFARYAADPDAHPSDGPILSHGCIIVDWGVIPDLPTPPGVTVTGFRGTGTPPVIGLFYSVFVFDGQLTVELSHPPRGYPADRIEQLAHRIEQALRAVAERA